ncbi:AAA family ATPase [Vibrio parahaemolyticus]|uniref:AAA family ATPase n=1 Tax=Vibrio parahaemolyticus TaxID=670 RepID=UPI003B67D342
MIKSFYAKNYKSFQKFDFGLEQINVLLGSNSCGKSSLTNLILLLSQTAESDFSYDSILRLNGDKASLGEALNIFSNKDKNKEVTIGWTLDDNYTEEYDVPDIHNYLTRIDRRLKFFYFDLMQTEHQPNDISIGDFSLLDNEIFQGEDGDEGSERQIELNELKRTITSYIKKSNKFRKRYAKNKPNLISRYKSFEIRKNISPARVSETIDTLYLHEDINKPCKIEYTFFYNQAQSECELRTVIIFNKEDRKIIELNVGKSKKITLKSDVISNRSLETSRLSIIKDINLKTLSLFETKDYDFFSENDFAYFVKSYISKVTNHFLLPLIGNNINHISPLRAFPQRYYLLEKSAQHTSLNATDGSQLAELLKNRPDVLKEVNRHFQEFGIKISTSKTNDIIHRITVKKDKVTVELTDVGFGISQVLPIIVQAILSQPGSVTIIEQPEIHLHPKMQAWLTNILVSISSKMKKKFIIETHSETVIKRLQILSLVPELNFSNKNLGIYYFERDDYGFNKITKTPLNEHGDISWPKDFMDQEISDAIQLQKLKVQALKASKGQ